MLLVLKGRLKVLNTPYLVYSYNKQSCIAPRAATIQRRLLFKSGGYSRAASDRADMVIMNSMPNIKNKQHISLSI